MKWFFSYSGSLMLLVALLLLNACSSMAPGYEQPQVNLTSFTLAPDSPGGPRFNIGLQVVNPNRDTIRLAGMSYSIEVEGNRILSGARNDLPELAGFSSTDLVIQASPDLLGGARLIGDLLRGPTDGLDYMFKARLDAGRFLPAITVEQRGRFNVNGSRP